MMVVLLNLFVVIALMSTLGAMIAGGAAAPRMTQAERTIGGTMVLSMLLMGGMAQVALMALS
jgi:hypothetical protein